MQTLHHCSCEDMLALWERVNRKYLTDGARPYLRMLARIVRAYGFRPAEFIGRTRGRLPR